jgi:hypothetical protein
VCHTDDPDLNGGWTAYGEIDTVENADGFRAPA